MANRWQIRCRHCKHVLPGDTKEFLLWCKCMEVKVKGNAFITRITANKEDYEVLTDRNLVR